MQRIQDVIGDKLAAWRDARGLNNQQVADLLNEAQGRGVKARGGWTRQSVKLAAEGGRSWVVSDLLALCTVMGASVGELLAADGAVMVGERSMTSAELHRHVTSVQSHVQAGIAHLRDLESLASVLLHAEAAYRELLSTLRYEFGLHPELLQRADDRYRQLIDQHRDTVEAAARRDVEVDFVARGKAPKGKEFLQAVRAEASGYLSTIPALRAARDARTAMQDGVDAVFPIIREMWAWPEDGVEANNEEG